VVPLIGYVDRFAAGPRETVVVKISSEFGDAYRADLVCIIHGDANPDRSRMTAEPRSGSQAAHDSGRGGFLGWLDYVLRQLSHNNYQNTSRGCWKTFCGAVPYQVNFCLDPMRPLRLRRLPGT
jgi:hypothetical protein